MDDCHSLGRRQRTEKNITPQHPQANHLDLLADHLEALRPGKEIKKAVL
jgi:phosphoribulokinase